MSINWITAYNRLFKIINADGETYYSGPAFLKIAQEVDDSIPSYHQYIEIRNQHGLSTSRKDFYWDIIKDLDDEKKYQLFRLFIENLEAFDNNDIQNLKAYVFGDIASVPTTVIPHNIWNSEKLNSSLTEIDKAIELQQFNRAVTLTYTCLEGIYKAYVNENIRDQLHVTDLMQLTRLVKNHISDKLKEEGSFPKEIVNSMSTVTNAVTNSRNEFSESHFDKDANKWLAGYARDLTNSVGRLVLHFINR